MSLKLKTILTSLLFIMGSLSVAQSAEINAPGFSGTMNTTVTSGFSMRTDRNCLSVRGYKTMGARDTGGAYADFLTGSSVGNDFRAPTDSADLAPFLDDGEGCAEYMTDGYGNAGSVHSGARDLISANADNGRTNYDSGDIFDVTQRVYSEITGSLDNGTGVNLSFVGTYNPLIDVAGNPSFAPFTSEQQDEIESDMRLLNAYITQDIPGMDAEITAGRFVTSWGESTFIPIGMNGLTTNALDLTSLRVPGSSIKEALMPTEQITVSGFLDGGWSYEAYYQMGESHIEADEAGQFFGSDVLNGDRLIISGQYSNNSHKQSAACNYVTSVVNAVGCNATALTVFDTAAGAQANDMYLTEVGLAAALAGDNGAALVDKFARLGTGAATAWGGTAGDIPVVGLGIGTDGNTAVLNAMRNLDEFARKGGRKAGAVDTTTMGHQFADGEDQYGFALRTYLDDVGTGLDLGFYYAQYDSKVPYLRFKGQQAITSGDMLGMFSLASSHAEGSEAELAGRLSGALGTAVTLEASETAGFNQVLVALADKAYGAAACSAYQKKELAHQVYKRGTGSNFLYTDAEISNAQTAYNYTNIGGKLYHDSVKCAANATQFGTAGTQNAAAALLGAAVAPLNLAEHQFIYPENIKVVGVSGNTNVGGTTVQAEIAYRPEFPLATDPGDQGQQLSDAVGTTNLLSQAVAKGAFDGGATATVEGSYLAGVGEAATFAEILTLIQTFKRSTLPAISAATVAAGDFYTTPFIKYDVWTGTLGTTSTFTASHPITAGLGADSSVFLTEIGVVHVDGIDTTTNGGVARGGYRDGVGGDKCGGITQGGANGPTVFNAANLKALDGMTHLGSAQTDPLFGNGSYCESNNEIDATSTTYRLIGSATYNNVANSAWTFSPSFVWSHDLSGYGPVSMGGFVPGRQSLSLGANLSKGDVRASINYVNQMGDEKDNLAFDMDYVSASVSYAF